MGQSINALMHIFFVLPFELYLVSKSFTKKVIFILSLLLIPAFWLSRTSMNFWDRLPFFYWIIGINAILFLMYRLTKNKENVISGHISKYVESGGVASLVMQCGIRDQLLIDRKNKQLFFASTRHVKTMKFSEIGNMSTRFTEKNIHGATEFCHCAIDFYNHGSDVVEMSIPFAKEKVQMEGVFETVKSEIKR